MDIFSRKIVGWDILLEEGAAHAAKVLSATCIHEGVDRNQLTLHSDNGAAMKGSTMLATMQWLGVVPSFSRPRTSNDNCYSEALFKTLKYVPEYPEIPFADVQAAKLWVQTFVKWYNTEHLHSGIHFVTPDSRHRSLDIQILNERKALYKTSQAKNPLRWKNGIRNWRYQTEVCINPESPQNLPDEQKRHLS